MSDGLGSPQRYCTNCGAELREGTDFCVSCGASLVSGQSGAFSARPEPESSESTASFADSLLGKLRGLRLQEGFSEAKRWLSSSRPNLDAAGVRQVPERMIGWFRGLPPVIKMLLAGVVLLTVVILLSPVMRVVAIIAFLLSAAFLIWHGVQRSFAPRWAVAAASSLALVFVFGGISGAVYGPDSGGSGGSGSGATGGSQPNLAGESPSVDALYPIEKDYIEQSADIYLEMAMLADRQTKLYNYCLEICAPESFSEQMGNMGTGEDLYEEAVSLEPPGGYEESHDAFVASIETFNTLVYRIGMQSIGGAEGDDLSEEAINYRTESVGLLPPEAIEHLSGYAPSASDASSV